MKWWKDGKEFQRNYPYEIKDIKHKTCLEMTSVSEEDLGIYTCEVTRENGNPAKANINLNGNFINFFKHLRNFSISYLLLIFIYAFFFNLKVPLNNQY